MNKSIDAVQLKRSLQKKAEKELLKLSQKEQIAFLHKKFGKPRKNSAA